MLRANASATVTVNETSSPNAGTNGSVTVCGNSAATNLLRAARRERLTRAAPGAARAPVGGSYDPATMSPGVYTYTLNATRHA
ncbi:MAG: hypothetical protein IPL52_08455 [Flavobacteriales bacterium]|nr:hypothetical protein [Flavobacteriales bacterium]